MLRAPVFALPYWIVIVPKLIAVSARGTGDLAAGRWGEALYWGGDLLLLLMFSSMRRRNGCAGWHDLASGTRVVAVPRRKPREAIDAPAGAIPPGGDRAAVRRVGPYDVVGIAGLMESGTMLDAFDPALKRNVWIHMLQPGTPAVGSARADLGRAGRLRWMNGRRAGDEAWDAYEAPGGEPLLQACAAPQPWRAVQHWIADLARELSAAAADGSTPALAPDRVWITRGSQARLLDIRAPGPGREPPPGAGDEVADPQRFLAPVMAQALGAAVGASSAGSSAQGPLPRLAQTMLDTLERSGFPSPACVAERAAALTQGPDHVTRARRAASILLANVPLLFALIALSIGLPTAVRLLSTAFLEMSRALVEIRQLDAKTDQESVKAREALELYVADRFGPALADERTWQDPRSAGLLTPLRPIAARLLAGQSSPSGEARRAAHAAAAARLGKPGSNRSQAISIATLLPAIVTLVSAIAAVRSALLFRGGLLLRSLGLAVVSLRGSEISRSRAAWRAAVAWSPILLLWLYVGVWSAAGREIIDTFSDGVVIAVAAVTAAAGCAWAILHPGRGLPDRLTGTDLVPR